MGYLFYGSVFVIIRRTLSHFIVHRFSFAIETHWNVRCKFGGVEFSTEMLIVKMNSLLYLYKKVQAGKDQEKAQSEKDSHSKNQSGKKPN